MATKKKATKKAAPKKTKKAAPKKAKKPAKKAKKPAKKKKGTKEILVVGSKVKEVLKANDMRVDGQLIQAVSDKVHELISAGVLRARENQRKTVKPADL